MQIWFDGMPKSVRAEIDIYGLTFIEHTEPIHGLNAAHIFVKERAIMEQHLTALRKLIDPAGQVWVSWPKKASKVATDITEDTIRSVCLSMGFVDIKVCAVDAIWSGLKLTIRKELR